MKTKQDIMTSIDRKKHYSSINSIFGTVICTMGHLSKKSKVY